VKSPLQAAHDQAAAEPIVCTVAAPRQPATPSVYTGAELLTRSTRPGAYDAMAIPSLMNGRKRLLGDRESVAPYMPREAAEQPLNVSPRNTAAESTKLAREFPTVHHRGGEYRPHPGSTPAKVLDYLRAMGGFISHTEICQRFNIKRSSITAAFKPALKRGVLVRQVVGGYTGFSLPGWRTSADPVAQTQPNITFTPGGHADAIRTEHQDRRFWPISLHSLSALSSEETAGVKAFLGTISGELYRPTGQGYAADEISSDAAFDSEQLSALYALSLREAELGLLLGYIAVLQLRRQYLDVAHAFPFSPLTEPPRLTDAA
jgi:hypothetical protein